MKWYIDGLKDAKKQLKNVDNNDIEDCIQRIINMKNTAEDGNIQGLLASILKDLERLSSSIKNLRSWVDSKIEKINQAESVLTDMNLGDVGSITGTATTMQTVIGEITKKYGESKELNKLNKAYERQKKINKQINSYLNNGGSRADEKYEDLRNKKAKIDKDVKDAVVASGNPAIGAIYDNTNIKQQEKLIEDLKAERKKLNEDLDRMRANGEGTHEQREEMHNRWVKLGNIKKDEEKKLEKMQKEAKQQAKNVTTATTVTGTLASAGNASDANKKKTTTGTLASAGKASDAKSKKSDKKETKKTETKKAETKKTETKKAETKKTETKKAETKKAETKKAETKKEEPKKTTSKKKKK